jgi:hypothetical protein
MFFQKLKEQIKKDSNFDIQRVERAYNLARSVHGHQKRKTGEPFVTHPVEVAYLLKEIGATEDMVCVALLHDVIENKEKHNISTEYLVSEFGEKVVKLIEILSKLKIWKTTYCRMQGNLTDLENGFADYPEAIIIKIADRVHNLQTLHGFNEEKQKEYLNETENFLMPIFQKAFEKTKSKKNLKMMEQLLERLNFEFNIKKGRFMKAEEKEREMKSEPLGIVKYEGWEGIREVYEEVLAEAIRTGEDILAFESNKEFNLGEEFTEEYVKNRFKNKIKAFVICPTAPEDHKYKDNHENKFTKIKLIKDLKFDANVNIVGDLVMTFSPNPEQGTLRRDRSEANTWKSLFKFMWATKN